MVMLYCQENSLAKSGTYFPSKAIDCKKLRLMIAGYLDYKKSKFDKFGI